MKNKDFEKLRKSGDWRKIIYDLMKEGSYTPQINGEFITILDLIGGLMSASARYGAKQISDHLYCKTGKSKEQDKAIEVCLGLLGTKRRDYPDYFLTNQNNETNRI